MRVFALLRATPARSGKSFVVVDSAPIANDNKTTIRCDIRKHGAQAREKPYEFLSSGLVYPLHILPDARSYCALEEEPR